MYSEKYELCIKFVIDHEGRVYEDHPLDPGGETKYGISKKSYPNEDIKNLTEEKAKDIYHSDYWTPLNCENYDKKMALALLDSGVNCGVGTVKQWFVELGPNITCETILFKRLRRYANIIQKNPKLTTFLLGWLIRVLHVFERG